MTLGPLPEIEQRPYVEGDFVVYGNLVFSVLENKEGTLTLENETDYLYFVSSDLVTLL